MAIVKGVSSGFCIASPSADPAGGPQPIDGRAYGIKDTAPAAATKITEIGWWCDTATAEANFEVGLYSHDAGDNRPGNRLYVEPVNAKGTGLGWKKVVVDWAITAGVIYWISAQLDDPGSVTNSNYSAEGGVGARFCKADGQTTLVNPWVTFTQLLSDYSLSVYAVYITVPPLNPYPIDWLKKKLVSGYHCFQGGYLNAKRKGYDPLKLPDGTVF